MAVLTKETMKNPAKSMTAEIRSLVLRLSFLVRRPPAKPPRQKNDIEIVNVIDIWETDQSGNSSEKGALKMDQA